MVTGETQPSAQNSLVFHVNRQHSSNILFLKCLNITLWRKWEAWGLWYRNKVPTVELYVQETLPKGLPAQGLVFGKAKSLKNQQPPLYEVLEKLVWLDREKLRNCCPGHKKSCFCYVPCAALLEAKRTTFIIIIIPWACSVFNISGKYSISYAKFHIIVLSLFKNKLYFVFSNLFIKLPLFLRITLSNPLLFSLGENYPLS